MTTTPRHVLVTGGGSGIGRAIAWGFAQQGCTVTAAGLDQADPWENTGRGASIEVRHLDVRDGDSVANVIGGLSKLDVLVNAAGTILRNGREHDPSGFAEVIDVNLSGTMRVCSAARELLFAARGCVINIASMLSFFGSGQVPAYSASKGGVAQLTKSLAIAWAAYGVRVNAIAPGWIETPLTRPLYEDAAQRERILARTPLGRWGQPEDLVGAALLLASPAAAFITGVVLPVDGGYSIA